jgi:hypothetical protein
MLKTTKFLKKEIKDLNKWKINDAHRLKYLILLRYKFDPTVPIASTHLKTKSQYTVFLKNFLFVYSSCTGAMDCDISIWANNVPWLDLSPPSFYLPSLP